MALEISKSQRHKCANSTRDALQVLDSAVVAGLAGRAVHKRLTGVSTSLGAFLMYASADFIFSKYLTASFGEQARDALGRFARIHFDRGLADLARDVPEAARQFQLSVWARPSFPDAQDNLGVSLALLGRMPEAAEHFSVAIHMQPAEAGYRWNMARALLATNRLSEAVTQFYAVEKLTPDDPLVHESLGSALARLDRKTEAWHQQSVAQRLRGAKTGWAALPKRAAVK